MDGRRGDCYPAGVCLKAWPRRAEMHGGAQLYWGACSDDAIRTQRSRRRRIGVKHQEWKLDHRQEADMRKPERSVGHRPSRNLAATDGIKYIFDSLS